MGMITGLVVFRNYLCQQQYEVVEKRSRSKAELVNHPTFQKLIVKVQRLVEIGVRKHCPKGESRRKGEKKKNLFSRTTDVNVVS